MLPMHGVNKRIGRLYTSGQSTQLLGSHDNSPLIQHISEDHNHIRRVDCIEIFGQISLKISQTLEQRRYRRILSANISHPGEWMATCGDRDRRY